VAPPMRYPPDRCSVIIAQCRGGMGGQAHVPSFIDQHPEFPVKEKVILQSLIFIILI